MVWYCENCKRYVEVCAEIQGSGVFSEHHNKETIWKSLTEEGFGDLLIRCDECDSTVVVWKETLIRLPTFKGYTVDARLREFRRADPEKGMEFIPFDCEKGKRLLKEMEAI